MGKGRPSKCDIIDANVDKIQDWASKGLSMNQIAKKLGVAPSTLYKHMNESEDFSNSVKKGREIAVGTLENTMFMCARGFSKTVRKYEKIKTKTYKDGRIVKEEEKVVPHDEIIYFKPDMTACIFLLKNWGQYLDNPALMKIRQEELELQRKKLDQGMWD